MTFSIAWREETPKLLESGDYDALAEHFKRQNAEADNLGLRLFSPFTGLPDALEPDRCARRLSQWARPLRELIWQRIWGVRGCSPAAVSTTG
jgi:hypothetical protein